MEAHLPTIWALIIAFAILLYVMLDGFDLGIGILFGTTRDEDFRRTMMNAIAPVWDGNETWLVFVGASLYAGFPMVYAILLPAFYLPVTLLLIALILRGVAFEFRYKTERLRWVWDSGFFLGSLIAAFVQGAAVGAIVDGLPIDERPVRRRRRSSWLSPFAIACGLGLVVGYMLIGACWLVLKTQGGLRDWAYIRILPLAAILLLFLFVAFGYAMTADLRVMHRWIDRPWLAGLSGRSALLATVGPGRRAAQPAATAGRSGWCADVPRRLRHHGGELLALHDPVRGDHRRSRGADLLAGVPGLRRRLFILPIVLAYTIVVYWVFRGKVAEDASYH